MGREEKRKEAEEGEEEKRHLGLRGDGVDILMTFIAHQRRGHRIAIHHGILVVFTIVVTTNGMRKGGREGRREGRRREKTSGA